MTDLQGQLSEADAKLTEADATLNDLQGQLGEAEARYNALSGELDEKLDTITGLNEQIESLNAQSETDAEQLEALQGELDAAVQEAGRQAAALEDSKADYEKKLAEVRAYKLSRELTTGDAHTATAVNNVIDVAADGVTATWHYDNTAISSNPVVLQLQVDGQTVYTSQPIQPGSSVEQVTLTAPLAPGSYDGIAVSSVYDDQGELLFANRVPVSVNVAGN